jgi:RNA polymerase sigma-B factor
MAPRARREARDRSAIGALLREYRRTGDPGLREQIVLAHTDLVRYLARRFADRGEPFEDLLQAAQVGLLHAVDRYDPDREVQFVTYATATIIGEIKRHFRDKTWSVHVPRRLREVNNRLMHAVEHLTASLGRSPTIEELAGDVGVPFEEAVEALEVGHAYSPVSLDAEVGAGRGEDATTLREHLGHEDPGFARLEDTQTIESVLRRLPAREQAVIRMRYYEERSQADIARELGISQMHVSRIQRDALRRLRELMVT